MRDINRDLAQALKTIDRPGSFCVSGSAPVVLPGLEVEGFGPVGLPLHPRQAQELSALCEQAPYGKGEETLVDPSVRRVRHLKPERFALTNPDWEAFLAETVQKVQEELGLEDQKLESHLYDLLLYEPGSFFLPHRDGEKLDRMVATLVIVLPSSFQGGELIVRHDGEEQTVDFGGGGSSLRIHYAAFYADCEHEVRPLRSGHRLCLVYNLTLKKGKKGITAPRSSEQVETITQILRDWAASDEAGKMVITLDHQYTKDGLVWDALKGTDRVKARVLSEAARQADCQAYLALLTFHESGSAEYAGDYRGRSRRGWDDEDEDDASEYEMGEVFDSSLSADQFSSADGQPLAVGEIRVEEEELLDPEALEEVTPEEEFEGYTGNAGMTLERWYRHAAIILWPNRRHFEILCDAGTLAASQAFKGMVDRLRKRDDAALRADCITFAAAIIDRWPESQFGHGFAQREEPCVLFESVAALDDPDLIKSYLARVLARSASANPGKLLVEACRKHGWDTFRRELHEAFGSTTLQTLGRNVSLLEQFCLAKPARKDGWIELCAALAQATVTALETIDREKADDYHARRQDRSELLAGLARALLATEQDDLLTRVVAHLRATPKLYPLTGAPLAALRALRPWLARNVKKPSASLSHWVADCREQLEALTAAAPEPPTDFRRDAPISCKCALCAELKAFLNDPNEAEHRFRAVQDRRTHLEHVISNSRCDLDCRTERRGSPHTLVCTKNTASYQEKRKKYDQDQEHLAAVRAIESDLPRG